MSMNDKHNTNLNKLYQHLLLEADKTTSRKEAVHLIHRADEVRLQMCAASAPLANMSSQ